MYLYDTLEGDTMISVAQEERPYGPSFSKDTLKYGIRMEIWQSSFEDQGLDFTEFKLINPRGHVIATAKVLQNEAQLDTSSDSDERRPEAVDRLLRKVLTEDEYAMHIAVNEAVRKANWKAAIEELPVEKWRKKLAKD